MGLGIRRARRFTFLILATAVSLHGLRTQFAHQALKIHKAGKEVKSRPLDRPRPAVTTWQYNRRRTGANLQETRLTPANVNPRQFGKVFTLPVDGAVYAQPLYLPGLQIPDRGRHNVIFVATEGDSVYAFDAAGRPRQPLWHDRFINPAAGVSTVTPQQIGCGQITPQIGITATPVIDRTRGVIYVIARTWEEGRFEQRLHALNVLTGAEMPHSPVAIRAWFPGTGDGSRGGRIEFDPKRNNARAALLLFHGQVYAAWSSPCDAVPYHGWLLGYNARTLRLESLFMPTPDSNDGGIWQSGAGPAAGRGGHIYVAIGNGGFDAIAAPGKPADADYGDSLLKLGRTLAVMDFFTPFDHHAMNLADNDLGSGGPVLLPRGLLAIAGKSGTIYLLHRARLGGVSTGDRQVAQAQRSQLGAMLGSPAYWNGNLYFASAGHRMSQFRLFNGRLSAQPAHRTREKYYYPGATPMVSAHGAHDGIVWALQLGAFHAGLNQPAVLHAYDARDIGRELFSSQWHPKPDTAGPEVKFVPPMVANGRVYVAAQNSITVYGLLKGYAKPVSARRRQSHRSTGARRMARGWRR